MSYLADSLILFLSRAQQKVADLATDITRAEANYAPYECDLRLILELIGAIDSLLGNNDLTWDEKGVIMQKLNACASLDGYAYKNCRPIMRPGGSTGGTGSTFGGSHQDLSDVLGAGLNNEGWHFTASEHAALLALLVKDASVTLSLTPALAEKGTSVTGLLLSYGINPGTYVLLSRTISRAGVALDTLNSPFPLSGTYTYAPALSFASARDFTVAAAFTGISRTASKTLLMEAPSYHGGGPVSMNEAAVKAGLSKHVALKPSSVTYSFTFTNGRFHFVYPASWGLITLIKDSNQFNYTDAYAHTTENYTLADGFTSEPMYHYVSNINTTAINFTLTFYF